MNHRRDEINDDDCDSPAYWRANERVALAEMLSASWAAAQGDPELHAQRTEWKARYDALVREEQAVAGDLSRATPTGP